MNVVLKCVLQLKAIEALLKSQPLSGGNARLSDVRVGTPWELQGNNIICKSYVINSLRDPGPPV